MAVGSWQVSRQPEDVSFGPQQTGIPPAKVTVVGSLDEAFGVFPSASPWTFEAGGTMVGILEEFRRLTQAADQARHSEFVASGQDGPARVLVQSL
jgi:hypothetical protein